MNVNLALTLLCLPAVSAVLPGHEWDTLAGQAFFHSSNISGFYADEAITFMAKFKIVTIEKWMAIDPHNDTMSANIITTLRAVKAANPQVATIFYYNSVCDFPQYPSLYDQFNKMPEGWLTMDNGTVIRQDCAGFYDMPVFNFTQAAVRALWESECINATLVDNGKTVDGCFVDRAVDGAPTTHISGQRLEDYEAGHLQATQSLQTQMGADKMVIANHAYSMPNVNSAQLEFCSASEVTITDLQECEKNMKICECHSSGDVSGLAAYLIGTYAGQGFASYYGYGPWDSKDTWSPAWEAKYWPTYFDKPLGTPSAAGVKVGDTWRRSFSSAKGTTSVTFNTTSNVGTIDWA